MTAAMFDPARGSGDSAAVSRLPGLVTTVHTIEVPLDHGAPDGEQITVFAREVVAAGKQHDKLPWLLKLQGGPGHHCERPTTPSTWLSRALKDYRVLLLDQRGTGRSTLANRQTLAARGSAAAQADYLAHFRADSIVRDAEVLRRALVGADQQWSVYGQSYGGFCSLTYLSLFPESLREVLITGGLPALDGHPDEVYRALYPRVAAKNEIFFRRYPGDQELARRVVDHLGAHEVRLPTGEALSPRRFQTLGLALGSQRRFDTLHYLLESAFVDGARGPELSDGFLHEVGTALSFAGHPLYALMHESIYVQGAASAWSAERVRQEFPAFDLGSGPVRFTGEMIYPWLFDEDPALTPLREVADRLAAKSDWPALYDPARLAANEVPCAAAVYFDDMYVDRDLSLATADRIGALRTWVTSQYEHDGAGTDEAVLDRLIAMAQGNT